MLLLCKKLNDVTFFLRRSICLLPFLHKTTDNCFKNFMEHFLKEKNQSKCYCYFCCLNIEILFPEKLRLLFLSVAPQEFTD